MRFQSFLVLLTFVLSSCGDDLPIAIQYPHASFTVSPSTFLTPCDGNNTVITLDASSSIDPQSQGITYEWSVDSATFVEGTDSGSPIAKVTFPGTEGTEYNVSLTVMDTDGYTDSTDNTITVPLNSAPIALFTIDPFSIPEGDNNTTVVTLDSSLTLDGDDNLLTYEWTAANATFVNGTSSESSVPQVTFPAPDDTDYPIMLTVTDRCGLQNSYSTDLFVF